MEQLVFALSRGLGVGMIVFGAWTVPELLQTVDKAPAIVIVPQLIFAASLIGFGGLLCLTATGLKGVLARLDVISERLPRTAAAASPAGNVHAATGAADRFARLGTEPVMRDHPSDSTSAAGTDPNRECPSCGRVNVLVRGKCSKCGWDTIAKRGPHGA